MSKDIIDIADLRKQFKEKASLEEWKVFSEHQQSLIEKLQHENSILQQKNKQLEHLLTQKTPLVTELSPEEVICMQQIRRLENSSMQRELNLEEVKRLDLLVKNLKLIREESTIVVNNRSQEILKEADLVAIARAETSSESNS